MTDPSSVTFTSFYSDQKIYTKPVASITEQIILSGQLSKGGLSGYQVSVAVTFPDGSDQNLSAMPTDSGFFKIGFPLDKNSQTGTYVAKAKYLQAESDEVTFDIKQNVSKIPTVFEYRPSVMAGSTKMLAMESKKTDRAVSYGDKIMVLFREGFVRHREGSFLHPSNHIYITISFEIKTGSQVFSPSFGTIKIPTGQYLPMKNIVLMPLTQIQDYFSLTVNAIEENELQAAQKKISQVIPYVNNIVGKIPVVGGNASSAVGAIGDSVNLIVALSPEHALISKQHTYAIDSVHYPEIDMDYLKIGTLDLLEEGARFENGRYYYKDTKEQPTRITLELVSPVK